MVGCSQLTVVDLAPGRHDDGHRRRQQRDGDATGVDSGRTEQCASPGAAWAKGKFTHQATHTLCSRVPRKLH